MATAVGVGFAFETNLEVTRGARERVGGLVGGRKVARARDIQELIGEENSSRPDFDASFVAKT